MQFIGTTLGGLAGASFGNPVLGAGLGAAVGHGLGWITGTGDYRTNFKTISNNAVIAPSFAKDDSVIVCHREYLSDVVAGTGTPTAFKATTYPLNPGNPDTFPWLAGIAANYEEFEILGMVFEYISTSGASVASSNTALGAVIMATEYDPTKPVFSNKMAMENYSFAISCRPSESMMHAVECAKTRTPVKQLYVRTGAPVANTDLRWTDFGNFVVATQGTPAASAILGELWCTYKIKLIKPRLPITLGLSGQIAYYRDYRFGVVTAQSMGTGSLGGVGTIAAPTYSSATVNWIADPGTVWIVTMKITAATSVSTLTVGGGSNSAANLYFLAGTASTEYAINTTEAKATICLVNTGSQPNNVMQASFTAGAIVGAAFSDLTISQIDSTE